MACYTPIKGYRSDSGVVFTPIEGHVGRLVEVPCGQCDGCHARRVSGWAVRIMHEAQMHERNSFLTLTYDDDHLPEDGSLDLRHWQLFAKRVRRRFGKFRYFHCGEYGPETLRPHYHAAIMGLDFKDDQVLDELTDQGHQTYTSPELQEIWGRGFIQIGSLTAASASYVAGYCMKKITGNRSRKLPKLRVDKTTGETFEVMPEYCSMSKRPGLGATWFERYASDVYPDDFVVDKEGQKRPTPKYYDSLLDDADLDQVKRKRRKRAAKYAHDNTPERLDARAFNHKERLKHSRRSL